MMATQGTLAGDVVTDLEPLRAKGETASASKPRVLFVSPVSDIKGGAERVLLELLANPFIDATLAVPEPGALSDAAERMNIPFACYHPTALMGVHRPPRLTQIAAAAVDAVRCAIRIRGIARAHRCELIHTNGLKAHAIGVIARALLGPRLLVHLHDIPHSGPERAIWRAIGMLATRVIVVSRPCWPGPLGRNVAVVPNGTRKRPLAPDAGRSLAAPRLGFVGRYHPHKGLDLLLDWAVAARAAGLGVSVVLRGSPDDAQPQYWPRIEARIRAEGLDPWITNQGWRGSDTLYDEIDYLLVPSRIPDPAPLVVGEAMTAGVVVIGYPAGGIPEMIPPGTGALARTPDEFVSALRAFLGTEGLYQSTRDAAYTHVRTARDPEVVARRFATVCASALGPLAAPFNAGSNALVNVAEES